MQGGPAIRTRGLSKSYADVAALRDVDLTVERGEVYAFLGRNGAGKTTTVRLLLGMLRPSAGSAEVLGRSLPAGDPSLWARVGYLVESATAYPDLTVRENLEVASRLQGLGASAVATDREIERLGLAAYADRRARTLSSGNLQRLALARALLNDPELLVLDEPTVGLDPAGVVEIRDLLTGLARDRGKTVFMSSHILTEVERLATRIGVVHEGRMVAELSAAELSRRRGRHLEVETREPAAAEAVLRSAGYAVRRSGPGAAPVLELHEDRAVNAPDDVARVLVEGTAAPTRLAVVRQDMEGFFLELTGGRRGEA